MNSRGLGRGGPEFPGGRLPTFSVDPVAVPGGRPVPTRVFQDGMRGVARRVLRDRVIPGVTVGCGEGV